MDFDLFPSSTELCVCFFFLSAQQEGTCSCPTSEGRRRVPHGRGPSGHLPGLGREVGGCPLLQGYTQSRTRADSPFKMDPAPRSRSQVPRSMSFCPLEVSS